MYSMGNDQAERTDSINDEFAQREQAAHRIMNSHIWML